MPWQGLAAALTMALCTFGGFTAWLRALGAKTSAALQERCRRRCAGKRNHARHMTFEACTAAMADVHELTRLYEEDYVQCHRRLHRGAASKAEFSEWEEKLGVIDFEDVISEMSGKVGAAKQAGRGSKGDKVKRRDGARTSADMPVRLLKCVEHASPGSDTDAKPTLVGYILYEVRTKKERQRARQHYCELINIVVREDYRGCGAGRFLFEALRADLKKTAPAEAGDLRLYVAERNTGPLTWYQRLGFVRAGFQTEEIGGVPVTFVRMVLRQQAPGDAGLS